MLNLSRRIGESIVIGDDIFLTVLRIKGNQVSIGFQAPNSTVIHRYEIYQKAQSEQQEVWVDPSKRFSPSLQQPISNQH